MAYLYASMREEDVTPEDAQRDYDSKLALINAVERDEIERAKQMKIDLESARQQAAAAHQRQHEYQMAAQQAEFDKSAKEHKEKLDDLYKEINSVARALRQSKLQSRRPSRVASSVSSRVPSPTGSTRETLSQAGRRLKREAIERNLREKQRSDIDKVLNLELPKTEKTSSEASDEEDLSD